MGLYNATLLAQVFNLLVLSLLLVAMGYGLYSLIVKIPRRITKNNEQVLNKLDRIAEALEKQQKRD